MKIPLLEPLAMILQVLIQAVWVASSAPPSAGAASEGATLASRDWSVNASPSLIKSPPSIDAVNQFTQQLMGDGTEASAGVNTFAFKDLRKTGNLSLLVTFRTGRGAELYIIDRVGAGYEPYSKWATVYGIDDVNDVVPDINHDGMLELVFDMAFTSYQGAGHCFSTWPVIYAWRGHEYSNVSAEARFRRFYEDLIKQPDSDDCSVASTDKIRRFLGNSDAGLSHAVTWASDSNPNERIFAVEILGDIATVGAADQLRKMKTDKNKRVVEAARSTFAYGHFFGKPPAEAQALDRDDLSLAEQDKQEREDTQRLKAGPWRVVIPPIQKGKVNVTADPQSWDFLRGFDSREQCEIGIPLEVSRYYTPGGPPPDELVRLALSHAKCLANRGA